MLKRNDEANKIIILGPAQYFFVSSLAEKSRIVCVKLKLNPTSYSWVALKDFALKRSNLKLNLF